MNIRWSSFVLILLIAGCEPSVPDAARQSITTRPAAIGSDSVHSGFAATRPDQRTLANLELLGRVWGYVKYYHPAVAGGCCDLDQELFKLLPLSRQDSFAKHLADWVKSFPELEPILVGNVAVLDDGQKYSTYDRSWWAPEIIGTELVESLKSIPLPIEVEEANRVLGADDENLHHYISFAPRVGNPIFKNEYPYPEIAADDSGMRILTLFRYWNMIEYFFPYKDLTDLPWSEVLPTYIPLVIAAEEPLEFQKVIYRLIGEVNDSHAGMWFKPKEMQDFLPLLRVCALPVYRDGKMVIAKLGEKNDSLDLGDVILAVDDRTTEELIEHYRPFCPGSNETAIYRDIGLLLLGSNQDSVTVKVDRQGRVLDLKCSTHGPMWGNWFGDDRRAGFEYIGGQDSIGYIYAASLNKGEIDRVMPENLNLKGLVVDLRNYPSRFIVFSLGKYLVPQPEPFAKFTVGSMVRPGDFYWTDPVKVGDGNRPVFKGKVVILVDGFTQSQPEYTAMALRKHFRSTVVGSTTAGADGNVSQIILPGGIGTSISGIGVFYPDGSPTQRIGIVPDIEVVQDFAAIQAGRDAQLDMALEIIRENDPGAL
ncbi:hypothetical protein CEQ90_10420 [Lewinellaceae bacterium SD302]|nr:hypothetical protein CEQ90_10420 [Lewinellaceae bacterium SD302]